MYKFLANLDTSPCYVDTLRSNKANSLSFLMLFSTAVVLIRNCAANSFMVILLSSVTQPIFIYKLGKGIGNGFQHKRDKCGVIRLRCT